MKKMNIGNQLMLLAFMLLASTTIYAQQPALQYFRSNDKGGLNVFETPKKDTIKFEGLKVRIGGDFALQFQGLSQSNDMVGDILVDLSSNFNLPTANLNIDVQLADGLRMHLRNYLSSRNHNEGWVKGGYLQLDKLDFIQEGFLSEFMKFATLRFGMDEINYGDTHFRRSDNARAIFNPFVGNYIMDAFTTEPFAELTLQKSGLIGVVGVSNGRLNQDPISGDDGIAFFAKLGYDNQINEDLRIRLTGSVYSSSDKSTRDYLYNGDRAGARYYSVLEGVNDTRVSAFLPRLNPGFGYQTAYQINPFVKMRGLEFFGVFEVANNGDDTVGGGYTQLGAEAIYRFGITEQLYIGGRYNSVTGESSDATPSVDINRLNIGGGWYMTKNVLTKLEYVSQKYDGNGFNGSKFQGAEFDGIVIEAVISF
ncbi:hypothetical protein BFP97_16520 [Roseivirga sp. 4D4]|uniref:hypothetical protein n=1 Tax=Roseivirga sp. 4D4 TaxID=1889784 RepID=UPI0008533FB2|nr:hypothetical protein [Roseivirga sp. 4D4]OEK03027.1 hypothetical protein BFP97_16520 [Roseivirga sp. 4D4]